MFYTKAINIYSTFFLKKKYIYIYIQYIYPIKFED